MRHNALYNVCAEFDGFFSFTATKPSSHRCRFSQLVAPERLPMLRKCLAFSKYGKYFRFSCVIRSILFLPAYSWIGFMVVLKRAVYGVG